MTQDDERDQLLRDMRVEVVWTDKATMSIPLYERMKDYIARARVGRVEVERRKAIAGLHGCRLAARGEYCASCVIQATNYEYQGEEDRRSKPHDYALSAKPVEVGELAGLIASVYNRPNYAQDTDGCTELAQAILNKYNVTVKE